MVNTCSVYGCHNRRRRESDRGYYRLPAVISRQGEITKNLSIERRKEWLAILNLKDTTYTNLAHLRVCSDHFVKGKPSVLYDTTNPDWAPSLNLGHNNSKNAASDVDRFERKMSQVLNVKKKAAASALVKLGTDKDECHQMEMSCGPSGKEIQPGFNSNVMNTMPCEIGRLSSENSSLNDLSDNNICKEKTEAEPLLWKQEKSSSLDKEESEAPQIKEEGEEVCIIEEGDQLDGKEKTGGFIVTEYDQQKMDSKSEPSESPDLEENTQITDGDCVTVQLDPPSDESSHFCDICGKFYIRSHNLKNHMKTHKGGKTVFRKICPKPPVMYVVWPTT